MGLQAYYEAFRSGYWASEVDCLCRGTGWALSDVDTWHKCPIHYAGQLDPESSSEEFLLHEMTQAGWREPVVLDTEAERFGYNVATREWKLRAGFPIYGPYDPNATCPAAPCEEDIPF